MVFCLLTTKAFEHFCAKLKNSNLQRKIIAKIGSDYSGILY